MDSSAAAFLRAHNMHPEQYSLSAMVRDFRLEMDRGLRGEASSLGMFPAYLSAGGVPRREESVLVIDAGGPNLRVARLRCGADGTLTVEALRRSRMPGTGAFIDAEEMFERIAREALVVCGESRRACISFSYPCEVLPDGDGRMIRLTKELRVRGLEGSLICAPLEAALRRLGAPGERRWRLINDTVGTLRGGMTECDRSRYDAYVGLILGTGTNTCCAIPAADILKSTEAAAMGGDMLVNLESGGFDKLPLGDADALLDLSSEKPGAQRAEKMISGGYYPQLLRTALLLAVEDGNLPEDAAGPLRTAWFTGEDVDLLLFPPGEKDVFAALLGKHRSFAREVNELLLTRAARITAAILAAILGRLALPAGSRACVCADGTTIQKSPLLRPRIEAYLARLLETETEFFFVSDATLLDSAWAALTD